MSLIMPALPQKPNGAIEQLANNPDDVRTR